MSSDMDKGMFIGFNIGLLVSRNRGMKQEEKNKTPDEMKTMRIAFDKMFAGTIYSLRAEIIGDVGENRPRYRFKDTDFKTIRSAFDTICFHSRGIEQSSLALFIKSIEVAKVVPIEPVNEESKPVSE